MLNCLIEYYDDIEGIFDGIEGQNTEEQQRLDNLLEKLDSRLNWLRNLTDQINQ